MNDNLKIRLTESIVFKLSLILILLSLIIILFSSYKLFTTPYSSIYVFLLINSLFFCLGIIFYQKFDLVIGDRFKSEYNLVMINKILKIVFYLNLSLILILLNQYLYTKGTLYYLAIAALTTILITQILIKPDKVKDTFFVLFFQIIPIALISIGSSYLINPYVIGPDTLWHFHIVQGIFNNGNFSIESYWGSPYFYYPLYHIIHSTAAILINSLSTIIFEMFNVILFVICVPIIYLIGKELFNSTIGLISALLFTILSSSIYLGLYNIGKIGGTLLFLICFYCIIIKKKKNNYNYSIVLFLTFIGIVLWHPEISLVVIIVLGADLISQLLTEKKIDKIDFSKFGLFSILFISYLIYVDFELFTGVFRSIFIDSQSPSMVAVNSFKNSSLSLVAQYLWAYISFSVSAFFISFVGLNWLKKLDKLNLFIICAIFGLVGFAAISVLTGNFGLNPERSLLYYSILTIFIFAYGLFIIFNSRPKTILPILIVFIFIFTLASTSSYFGADGNDFFNDQIPKTIIFTTQSNLATYNFLEKTPNGSNISSDYESIRYLSDPIRGFYSLPNRNIIILTKQDFINSSYFLINKPNLDRINFQNTDNGEKINKLTRGINLLYNNGDLKIYN